MKRCTTGAEGKKLGLAARKNYSTHFKTEARSRKTEINNNLADIRQHFVFLRNTISVLLFACLLIAPKRKERNEITHTQTHTHTHAHTHTHTRKKDNKNKNLSFNISDPSVNLCAVRGL